MKVKKIISMLLAGVMALGLLAGCGSQEETQANEEQQETQIEEDTTNDAEDESQSEPAESSAQNSDGNILIAYFSIPEDIDVSGSKRGGKRWRSRRKYAVYGGSHPTGSRRRIIPY